MRVSVSTFSAKTFLARLISHFIVLAFLVVLQTQLISSVPAEVMFLNKWGGQGSGDGQLNTPSGIALSDTGQVYVTDSGNDRIQRFDADGNYQMQWGSEGGGDGEFRDPYDITLSGMGQVYVADDGNNRIQRFDADGNYQMQWGSEGSGEGCAVAVRTATYAPPSYPVL